MLKTRTRSVPRTVGRMDSSNTMEPLREVAKIHVPRILLRMPLPHQRVRGSVKLNALQDGISNWKTDLRTQLVLIPVPQDGRTRILQNASTPAPMVTTNKLTYHKTNACASVTLPSVLTQQAHASLPAHSHFSVTQLPNYANNSAQTLIFSRFQSLALIEPVL
jgi:hypothetical protein